MKGKNVSANINNITEDDFSALVQAANWAQERGDSATAAALDKLARKANAALTNAKYAGEAFWTTAGRPRITWKSVPTTLLPVSFDRSEVELGSVV